MSNVSLVENNNEESISYSNDDLYNISSWGADMTFRELTLMYSEGDLVKPELQRKFVWTIDEASRFIDSILLGLPVPSIFLAVDTDEKRLIVDGYQRIMSVNDFFRGIFTNTEKVFRLSNKNNINKKWRGKTFDELTTEEKRRIRTTTIHAIIFEQKHPKDDTGMYQIFERINTSGKSLKSQEIRNCVYQGSFNSLLFKLNLNDNWRKILRSEKEDSRMGDIELILRFFAMSEFEKSKEFNEKQINLNKYLNEYMGKNRNLIKEDIDELENQFVSTLEIALKFFGINVFKRKNSKHVYLKKIHPTTFDAVAVSILKAIEKGFDFNENIDFSKRYENLLLDKEFQNATSSRTTNVVQIKKRFNIASRYLFDLNYFEN
ncbi:DUF262 domain-containing protein [Fundicoccus culcitae]|uniref:DUF262 domain-containing protein n=1 Tax=Fundicoccus culcitae TaxID=2969821 RepID=A0ABY5P8Z9_9LACT|nr:DUF262 domain-containing protein [Fundicoccus culcitae]UUX35217.1 DUF262 domain-containing protein [Fundicoccus culcitae]